MRSKIGRVVVHLQERISTMRYRIKNHFGRLDALKVLPYLGYGTRDRLYISRGVFQNNAVLRHGLVDERLKFGQNNTHNVLPLEPVEYDMEQLRLPLQVYDLRPAKGSYRDRLIWLLSQNLDFHDQRGNYASHSIHCMPSPRNSRHSCRVCLLQP